MTRQLPLRPLGITDKGRKLHVMYHALGAFNNYIDAPDRSGCGRPLLRRATEDEKRMMTHCTAPGCAGVPHE